MTLHFEKAGDVTVDVAVQKKAPGGDKNQMHMH
jgi:copper(I)-binding protein